jgi:hypothetical protein
MITTEDGAEFGIVGYDKDQMLIGIMRSVQPVVYDWKVFGFDEAQELSNDLANAASEAYSIQLGVNNE